MKRRDFCSALGLATIASLTGVSSAMARLGPEDGVADSESAGTVRGTPPQSKKILFFDLWKLDAWDNMRLVQGEPEWVAEATYVDDVIPGKGAGKPSVFYDETAGVWRMLYNIGWSPIRLMMAVSEDGIHWQPDPQPEIEIPANRAGGKQAAHHVFTMPDAAAGGVYVDPQAADGFRYKLFAQLGGKSAYRRALEDARSPWHEIAKAEGEKRYFHQELILVSPDGLRWEPNWNYVWSRGDWHPEPVDGGRSYSEGVGGPARATHG